MSAFADAAVALSALAEAALSAAVDVALADEDVLAVLALLAAAELPDSLLDGVYVFAAGCPQPTAAATSADMAAVDRPINARFFMLVLLLELPGDARHRSPKARDQLDHRA